MIPDGNLDTHKKGYTKYVDICEILFFSFFLGAEKAFVK